MKFSTTKKSGQGRRAKRSAYRSHQTNFWIERGGKWSSRKQWKNRKAKTEG